MFGKKLERFTSPKDFTEKFIKLNTIIGGLFLTPASNIPELLVARNPLTKQLYICENFALPRRAIVFLPVEVYETNDSIFKDSHFREIVTGKLVAA